MEKKNIMDIGGSMSAMLAAAGITRLASGWIIGGRRDRPCDLTAHVHRADATLADMVLEESTYDSSMASTGTSQSAWALDCKGGAAPIAVQLKEDGSTASGQRWSAVGETLRCAIARLGGGYPPALAILTHTWRHVDGEAPEDSVRIDFYHPPVGGWESIS